MSSRLLAALAAAALLSGVTYARAADTQPDGTAANPPGTAASRAFDRAAGTDVSGAYPQQRDGTPGNPPGTAVERTYDRATGSNTSGAYPQNSNRGQ